MSSFVVYVEVSGKEPLSLLDRRATLGTEDGGYADVDGQAFVVRAFTPQIAEALWEAAAAAGGLLVAGDDVVDVAALRGPDELYARWS